MAVKLVDPAKTKLIAASRLKHDKVDSEIIAELLRIDFIATAYLAPQSVRDLRELVRWRMFFIRLRTRTKNRVHSLLWKHGLESPVTDLFENEDVSGLRPKSSTSSMAKRFNHCSKLLIL